MPKYEAIVDNINRLIVNEYVSVEWALCRSKSVLRIAMNRYTANEVGTQAAKSSAGMAGYNDVVNSSVQEHEDELGAYRKLTSRTSVQYRQKGFQDEYDHGGSDQDAHKPQKDRNRDTQTQHLSEVLYPPPGSPRVRQLAL